MRIEWTLNPNIGSFENVWLSPLAVRGAGIPSPLLNYSMHYVPSNDKRVGLRNTLIIETPRYDTTVLPWPYSPYVSKVIKVKNLNERNIEKICKLFNLSYHEVIC